MKTITINVQDDDADNHDEVADILKSLTDSTLSNFLWINQSFFFKNIENNKSYQIMGLTDEPDLVNEIIEQINANDEIELKKIAIGQLSAYVDMLFSAKKIKYNF
jgi:hypothetical protein